MLETAIKQVSYTDCRRLFRSTSGDMESVEKKFDCGLHRTTAAEVAAKDSGFRIDKNVITKHINKGAVIWLSLVYFFLDIIISSDWERT